MANDIYTRNSRGKKILSIYFLLTQDRVIVNLSHNSMMCQMYMALPGNYAIYLLCYDKKVEVIFKMLETNQSKINQIV